MAFVNPYVFQNKTGIRSSLNCSVFEPLRCQISKDARLKCSNIYVTSGNMELERPSAEPAFCPFWATVETWQCNMADSVKEELHTL